MRKNCDGGNPCKGACISRDKNCQGLVPPSNSSAIDSIESFIGKAERLRNEIDSNTSVSSGVLNSIEYEYVPDNEGNLKSVKLSLTGFNKSGSVKDINFEVNGSYDEDVELTRKEKLKAARVTKRLFDRALEDLPNDTILFASAWDNDGKGDVRLRKYIQLGFKYDSNSSFLLAKKTSEGLIHTDYQEFDSRLDTNFSNNSNKPEELFDEEEFIDLDLLFAASERKPIALPTTEIMYSILFGEELS